MAKKYIDTDELMRRMYNRAFETDGDTMWQSGCWVRYRAIEAFVKETPAADVEPRWIPVTERLPEEAGQYLVSGKWANEDGEVWICKFARLYNWGWCNMADRPVVQAWMPLPTPYKGGEEE